MRRLILAAALAVVGTLAAACNDGTSFGLGLDGDGTKTASNDVSSTGQTCAATNLVPLDPATLPACSPNACGGAHCVPTDKVPAEGRAVFASCDGGAGLCVPDPLIRSGGAKPPTCKSLGGAAGVCLGLCVPKVADNKDILPQDSCASDERCTPCVDPGNGQETGACAIGQQAECETTGNATPGAPGAELACPHVGAAVVEPSTLPACAAGAHCLPARLTPADMTSKLATCSGAPGGGAAEKGWCVPDKLIATGGRFIPKTCSSVGGAEGRCLGTALPEVSSQSFLPQATCDANEKCVPCTSPVDGKDTGACKTSCDPGPSKPAVKFSDCCGLRGKCVPRDSIPANMSSNLQPQECGNALCVPTENVTPGFKPPACRATRFLFDDYTGVCLSNCLDFGFGSDFALDKGNCSAGHTCVPCFDDGKPTGAPGCN